MIKLWLFTNLGAEKTTVLQSSFAHNVPLAESNQSKHFLNCVNLFPDISNSKEGEPMAELFF